MEIDLRVIPHRRIIIPFNPQLLHESVYSVSFRLDGLLSTNLHGGEELCIQASKNININNGGNDMIYVGIDVAKTKHDFFIVGERGERIAGPVTIKNNLNGFNTSSRLLKIARTITMSISGWSLPGITVTTSCIFYTRKGSPFMS